MEYKKYKRICVLDLETTGVFWSSDAPIQIAAIVCDASGKTVDEFNERIKTTHKINPEASAVHGIYAKDLVNCRSEAEVLQAFVTWMIGNGVDCLLTYNGKAFDVPMLNCRCEKMHLSQIQDFNKDSDKALPHIDGYYDCVYPAKKANLFGLKDKLGRKWKLTMVADILGIDSEGAHDAYVDVTMLKNIFFKVDPLIHPNDWADNSAAAEMTTTSLF
jgi:DNA polymerase III alpha subunit (gram-positive type)